MLYRAAWILTGIAVLLAVGGFLLLSGKDRLWAIVPAILLMVAATTCSIAALLRAVKKSDKG